MRSIFATSHHSNAFLKFNSTSTSKLLIYFGIKVCGPHTLTNAPNFCKQNIFESATRECNISPTMTIFFPFKLPNFSCIENASNKA